MVAIEEVCKECKNTNGEHLPHCSRFKHEDAPHVAFTSIAQRVDDFHRQDRHRLIEAAQRVSQFLDDIEVLLHYATAYPKAVAQRDDTMEKYSMNLNGQIRHSEYMMGSFLQAILNGSIKPPNEG